jgi:hypothetical protein
VAARILLADEQYESGRLAIERACMEVPLKQISTVLLDYAKYYELIGDRQRALSIMGRIRQQGNIEWKVQFDAVVMLMRMGLFPDAEVMIKDALGQYSAKGRLWALLIQLQLQRARTTADFEEVH